MEKPARYTLGKTEKLKSRKLIGYLFENGHSFSLYPFRVVWSFHTPDAATALQCGFSVSTKNFKKATDRNRIKRLMREAWRMQKNELQEQLRSHNKTMAVFLIFTGNEIPAQQFVFEKTALLLKRLKKNCNEAVESNN